MDPLADYNVEVYQTGNLEERKIWYNNGQIKRHEFYRDGKPEGEWKAWLYTGSLYSSKFYLNGKLDGKYKNSIHDGYALEEYHYRDGKLEGECVDRFSDGLVHSRHVYRNGNQIRIKIWQYISVCHTINYYLAHDIQNSGESKTWNKNGHITIHSFSRTCNEIIDENFNRKKKRAFIRVKEYFSNKISFPLENLLISDLINII